MPPRHLPILTTGTLAALIVAGALLDPVGYFSLYGMPGRLLPATRWQAALPLQVPVLLGLTYLVTRTFSHLPRRRRFATVWAGIVLSALVAKFVMTVAASAPLLNLADLAWATSYTVFKAGLYALPPAAVVLAGRPLAEVRDQPPAAPHRWTAALVTVVAAGTGEWSAAHWNTDLPDGVPSLSPSVGALGLAGGLVIFFLALSRALHTFGSRARDRVGTFFAAWLATLWAGAALGLAQVLVLIAVDGFGSPLRVPVSLYLRVSEGVALGAALGPITAITAIAALAALRHAHRVRAATARLITVGIASAVTAGSLAAAGDAATSERPPPTGAVSGELLPLSAVRGENPRIVDSAGRQVLLRGINVNQLVDFYAPRPDVPATVPLTEADFVRMAELGFNVVRLGFSWSKVEPERGRYDQEYLRRLDEAVALAEKHGMYTVLDMHQDGWSNEPTPAGTTCPRGTSEMWGYDGAPDWATITDGAPRCQFTGRDLSPAGNRAFTNFYFDRDGVQTRFVEVWAMLAARYGDEPAIAGFDPLNEPGFAELAPVTSTLLLGKVYDRVLNRIRRVESRRHLFFFEPSIFWSGLGFDAMPRGTFRDDPDLVFSPRLYAESITMDASLGLPAITDLEHGFTLAKRVAGDLPLWSGEWGFWGGLLEIRDRVRRYARAEDAHRIGGAFWVWKQACGDPQNGIGPIGNGLNKIDCAANTALPREPVTAAEVSRAYPRAVPGELTSLRSSVRDLALTGTASRGDCTVDVWVPGAETPETTAVNIADLTAKQAPGGWRVTGCASGNYRLTTR
ncbi:hypothetical protein GCM10009550_09270 [Actinocorallia libanotica]|uniref:Glycoside hydrolase family 5 domain-containing protein n=1 Tax=Actinocorallia libanotica TaxID=46162 RepID=A0ABN1QAZ8_9ACTN